MAYKATHRPIAYNLRSRIGSNDPAQCDMGLVKLLPYFALFQKASILDSKAPFRSLWNLMAGMT